VFDAVAGRSGSNENTRRRSAFTLLEMVAVMAMFSVIMLLIASMLWGAFRIERAGSAASERRVLHARVADLFRSDVRGAVATVDRWKDVRAGADAIILKLGDEHHVAYRWLDGRLKRLEANGVDESTLSLPVGDEDVTVTFSQAGAAGRVVVLRVIESRGVGGSRRDHVVEFAAAVGGDRR
jgi:prepilin-type N-terminal cleavage/methylation domain-containing protein